jgi:ATP-dependent 26S proteasome regulatory subunit
MTATPERAPTSPAAPRPRFVTELDTLIRARNPLLWLVSSEEQRVEALLAELAEAHGKVLLGWSITKGIHRLGGAHAQPPKSEGSEDPIVALQAIAAYGDPSLVVLKDFHPYLSEPRVIRALRELGHALKSTYTTVIVLAPVLQLPVELEKEMSVLDVPLPTFRDLAELLRDIIGVVRTGGSATVQLNRAEGEQLVKAALGLTLQEAENAFAKAIAEDQRLDASDIQRVMEEKRQVIRKSGLLEYYPAEHDLHGVGGLESLKDWLSRRATAFTEAARQFGLPEPKGLLLLGVQGCGKSLTAKAIASQWTLPLLRLDVGRIFSGLVGSSEENLRRAIRVAESAAPAVLWVDEIDKALAGAASSGAVDAGVSARVLGTFLTWLQEKKAAVFVVATANRVDALPPELLRKGRFDEIFFIDLPDARERTEILAIHVRRRGRDPKAFDLAQVAAEASNFSGAELEQVVVEGLYQAFAEGTDLTNAHLLSAVAQTFPLAVTLAEEIERLREWAAHRTRPASRPMGVPA